MGVETTRRGAVITCTIREGETLYRVDQRGPRVVVPGGRIPGVYAGLDAGAVGGCEYVLDSPTGTAIVGRAMLPTPATHELRSIDGRIRIPVKWHGSLEREHTPGVTLTFPVGARWPVGRATLPPEPTLALALTVAERDTRRADSLLAGSAPFYLIHTPQACMIEDCQVPTRRPGG